MAAILSIITTCKGRLDHLKQTLPWMVAQPDAETIVVDYDCPDGATAWVRANHPATRIIKVDAEPLFCHARARNLGAHAAVGQWLSFVDADTRLNANYSRRVVPLLRDWHYFRPAPMHIDAWGHVICRKTDFEAIEGYDEVMRGWGGEDDDLYMRLGLLGRKAAFFPGELVESIGHGSADRVRFSDVADRWVTQRAHAVYCCIKFDLIRVANQVVLPLSTRLAIYEEVRRTVVADANRGAPASRITIHLPTELRVPMHDWTIRRQWTFDLEKVPGTPPPQP
ncbi:MAG: glycosyltransferase family A protein [Sulfuritalea sp.]|nr:glycosyltransferase family A protein [Sulfuritalea sp.]